MRDASAWAKPGGIWASPRLTVTLLMSSVMPLQNAWPPQRSSNEVVGKMAPASVIGDIAPWTICQLRRHGCRWGQSGAGDALRAPNRPAASPRAVAAPRGGASAEKGTGAPRASQRSGSLRVKRALSARSPARGLPRLALTSFAIASATYLGSCRGEHDAVDGLLTWVRWIVFTVGLSPILGSPASSADGASCGRERRGAPQTLPIGSRRPARMRPSISGLSGLFSRDVRRGTEASARVPRPDGLLTASVLDRQRRGICVASRASVECPVVKPVSILAWWRFGEAKSG
jgi:hypothetical protein